MFSFHVKLIHEVVIIDVILLTTLTKNPIRILSQISHCVLKVILICFWLQILSLPLNFKPRSDHTLSYANVSNFLFQFCNLLLQLLYFCIVSWIQWLRLYLSIDLFNFGFYFFNLVYSLRILVWKRLDFFHQILLFVLSFFDFRNQIFILGIKVLFFFLDFFQIFLRLFNNDIEHKRDFTNCKLQYFVEMIHNNIFSMIKIIEIVFFLILFIYG